MADRPDTPVASFVGVSVDLEAIRRVVLVRLRSIGDTVLMTPCISTIKRWRPDVEVDVVSEPFCAPLLEEHPGVSRVVVADRRFGSRLGAARELRRGRYDVAINLNGGSTAAALARASGARVRVGFAGYRHAWLANCRVTSSHDVWRRTDVHTVEHQLALVAGIGIPAVANEPTSLAVCSAARASAMRRLAEAGLGSSSYVVLHPEATFESKRWPSDRFARLADECLRARGARAVVIGMDDERVRSAAGTSGIPMPNLSLAETMAVLEGADLFVGNDSGPAHIAAAFDRPVVVIFGPSDTALWRPWTRAPWRIVSAPTASDVAYETVTSAIAAVLENAPHA